jgi:hypothetical protein
MPIGGPGGKASDPYKHVGKTMRVNLATDDFVQPSHGMVIRALQKAADAFGGSNVQAAAQRGMRAALAYLRRRTQDGLPTDGYVYYGYVGPHGVCVDATELEEL